MHVQAELGLRCGAFDVNAAVRGSSTRCAAQGFIAIGAQKILVIGTDTLSRITDWTDRNTAILFADGSGAVVLEATDGPGEILGWDIDADGTARGILYADVGGYLHMDGKEVFRRAVRIMVDSATKSMNARRRHRRQIGVGGAAPGQRAHHQAACDRLGVGSRRTVDGAAPHRQHVVGVHPAGPGRLARHRPRQARATSCCSSASAPA